MHGLVLIIRGVLILLEVAVRQLQNVVVQWCHESHGLVVQFEISIHPSLVPHVRLLNNLHQELAMDCRSNQIFPNRIEATVDVANEYSAHGWHFIVDRRKQCLLF